MAIRRNLGVTEADRKYSVLDAVQDAFQDCQIQVDEQREETIFWQEQHDLVTERFLRKRTECASLRSVNTIKDDTIAIQARRSARKDQDIADLKRQLAARDKTIAVQDKTIADQRLLIQSLR